MDNNLKHPYYSKKEIDTLINALRINGFCQYSPFEWVYEPKPGRWVKVTINEGRDLTVNFNDENVIYPAPSTVSKVLLNYKRKF